VKQEITRTNRSTQGIVKENQGNRLKVVHSTEHTVPLYLLNTTLRLAELAKLKDGWLDGKGRAAAKEKLDWLASSFHAWFDAGLPLPYLYPTAEGGIQAEWTLSGWEVSLEIDLETQQGDYQAFNLRSDECNEFSLSLRESEGWNHLNEALKQLEAPEAVRQPRAS
jgi:hypothetical protein